MLCKSMPWASRAVLVCSVAMACMWTSVPTAAQTNQANADSAIAAYGEGDFARARDIWLIEAQEGNELAQFNLGHLYQEGKGVAVDYEEALHWYSRSVEAGCRIAACNLASLYSNGLGAPADHGRAIRLLAMCGGDGRKCADQQTAMRTYAEERLKAYSDSGYADAQYELADLYIEGRMRNEDWDRVVPLLKKAAEQQHGMAQVSLGECYLFGTGVSPDVAMGEQLILRALEQNVEDLDLGFAAKAAMAVRYEGYFVNTDPDRVKAYVWAQLGLMHAEDANPDRILLLQGTAYEAEQAMTADELNWAKRLTAEWSELFADGLPDVSIEDLLTLSIPQ